MLVEESALPESAQRLSEKIIAKSKLKGHEKQQAQKQLAEEWQITLASITEDELLERHENPKTKARQLRKQAKRNRPFAWHLRLWFCRLLLTVILAIILAYIGLVIFFATSPSAKTVDYLAKRNRAALAVPEDQRAWPLLRAAIIEHDFLTFDGDKLKDETGHFLWPEDEAWPEAQAYLNKYQGFIEALHELSEKPGLGFIYRDLISAYSEEDQAVLFTQEVRNHESSRSPATFLAMVQGLPLDLIINISELIQADLIKHTSNGQVSLAIKDIRLLLRLSDYLKETGIPVMELLALGYKTVAINYTQRLIYTDQLDIESLSILKNLFSESKVTLASITHQQYELDDATQTLFCQHGYLNHRALVMMDEINGESSSLTTFNHIMLMPFYARPLGSRTEFETHKERIWKDLKRYHSLPLWQMLKESEELDMERLIKQPLFTVILEVFSPTARASIRLHAKAEAKRQALLLLLSVQEYKLKYGKYPVDLESTGIQQRTNSDMIDHSTGKQILYRLTPDGPMIYGRGLDGDDDGGSAIEDWDHEESDGDWVLYPNAELLENK